MFHIQVIKYSKSSSLDDGLTYNIKYSDVLTSPASIETFIKNCSNELYDYYINKILSIIINEYNSYQSDKKDTPDNINFEIDSEKLIYRYEISINYNYESYYGA